MVKVHERAPWVERTRLLAFSWRRAYMLLAINSNVKIWGKWSRPPARKQPEPGPFLGIMWGSPCPCMCFSPFSVELRRTSINRIYIHQETKCNNHLPEFSHEPHWLTHWCSETALRFCIFVGSSNSTSNIFQALWSRPKIASSGARCFFLTFRDGAGIPREHGRKIWK